MPAIVSRVAAVACCAAWLSVPAHAERSAHARFPAPDCEAYVAYDRDMTLPGYRLRRADGGEVCVPFTTVGPRPPAGYAGDFYVAEFAEATLRNDWLACKTDPAGATRIGKVVAARSPPNREQRIADPHHRYLLGKIAEADPLDLRIVRRPGFFARDPYREPIAAVESSTYTVEFTAPAEPYERIHRGLDTPVKLRGWYLRGAGVADLQGRRTRALIVMTGGGGTRLVAIEHPSDRLYGVDSETGRTSINSFPNATTGSPGQAGWRSLIAMFHEAGFDVLAYDRRGVGVSSGYSDTNTLQQGRDLLDALDTLRTGAGLRVLTPSGRLHDGVRAARELRGRADELRTLLVGNSRGTMSSGWAMTMNFHRDCSYDLPDIACSPPRGNRSIKGALLMAEFTSGPGFVSSTPTPEDEQRGLGRDRDLFIGASQLERNIVFFPGSGILAGMHAWPAAFFARGLWDYAASLEGTINSYDRVAGLKELVVVRGPHPYETWPEVEKQRVRSRMLAFARAAIHDEKSVPGERTWTTMRELVATTEDAWEVSSAPGGGKGP
jgi:pimeloyl-ACP methyl ester carboxylesterase